MKIEATKEMWFITDGEIKHKGKLEEGQWIESLSNIQTFETEEEWNLKVKELGLERRW